MKWIFTEPRRNSSRPKVPRWDQDVPRGLDRDPNRSENAVALVITLILLAVITTLAIAFLALTYRETASVDALGSTVDSELAAESALERSRGEILSPFPVHNSGIYGADIMGPDMMVSVAWDTNRMNSAFLTNDASPPVFVRTNNGVDDRFFLDLNRNWMFEETGYVPVLDDNFRQVGTLTNWAIGDPQWIGVLQRPGEPHGPNNRFIARYAFLIQPAGRSLDINWIHNQARNANQMQLGINGYLRNQGVGTWEMNLAAFLADLNPNYWGDTLYTYPISAPPAIPPNGANTALGDAFADAREFLSYRYLFRAQHLLPVNSLLPNVGNYFAGDGTRIGDGIDNYSNGPLDSWGVLNPADEADDAPTQPWPGADSTNHIYSLHDFLDSSKLANTPGFISRIQNASSRGSTSNRYSFYQLLAQLGTDSVPERDDKINLNYINVGGISASQFVSWTNQFDPTRPGNPPFKDYRGIDVTGPELFFNNTASLLLSNEFARVNGTNTGLVELWKFGVFTNGVFCYTPRVHQLLQITANIYESMVAGDTNTVSYPFLPTVFRPTFRRGNPVLGESSNDIYLNGYVDESRKDFSTLVRSGTYRWSTLTNAPAGDPPFEHNFYDVPIIFGSREGIPSFNEFNVQSYAYFGRKLQLTKNSDGSLNRVEQQFIFGVSNVFFAEGWNSLETNRYSAGVGARAYPRPVELLVTNRMTTVLTNSTGLVVPVRTVLAGFYTNIGTLPQTLWTNGQFKVSDLRGVITAEDSILTAAGAIPNQGVNTNRFEPIQPRGTNNWGLTVENQFGYFLFDNGRLIDAFTSARMNMHFDISKEMRNSPSGGPTRLWDYAPPTSQPSWPPIARNFPRGIADQIEASLILGNANQDTRWVSYAGTDSKSLQIPAFRDFFLNEAYTNALSMQTPFNPIARKICVGTWQVNDPLVHYNEHDLYKSVEPRSLRALQTYDPLNTGAQSPSLGKMNDKYNPWGGRGNNSDSERNSKLKDPSVTNSAAWDFPSEIIAQKLPNIGWLGRIHRGTPWQTIYMKSQPPSNSEWASYVGYSGKAAEETNPVRDRRLFDLFTVAPHPNATRGRLSINQTNLAAWSALLSGVVVTEIEENGGIYERKSVPISPVSVPDAYDNNRTGPSSRLMKIFEDINAARGTNQFTRLGDLLSVTNLTDGILTDDPGAGSPLIPFGISVRQDKFFPATDADYEAIPQQIMSLVQVGEPRFVVYSWGQSLKPARFGVEEVNGNLRLAGPSILTTDEARGAKGLCINYQITGETATRAVVRVDFERDPATGRPDYTKPHAVVERFNTIPIE